jgi:tetratricopeptide (TPR) repeat protein
MQIRSSSLFLALLAPLFVCGHDAFAQCGDLANAYGPYDYRTASNEERTIVDGAHFTPNVERLIRGKTSTTPGPDIAYTLRAFPNHPRALHSMMNLGFATKSDKPEGSTYSVECWFDRAERFVPDDGTVQMLFGIYILRKGDPPRAIEKFKRAQELSGESANLHYNFGLAYFDLRDYDHALDHARSAYRQGFPLPGLRNKLQEVGKWQPVETPASAEAPPNDKQGPGGRKERDAPGAGRTGG